MSRLIGADDPPHEIVADHIAFPKHNVADSLKPGEKFDRLAEPRLLARRKIGLRGIAR